MTDGDKEPLCKTIIGYIGGQFLFIADANPSIKAQALTASIFIYVCALLITGRPPCFR